MIERALPPLPQERLAFYSGIVLLGPRQVGKTTLARAIAARHPGALLLDLERPAERRPGRFLLPGSASGALQQLWHRGGFPLAHLAPSDRLAYAWRQDFIQTFLQRDLPQMGMGVAADTLHRFWRMLAHLQGQLFNASQHDAGAPAGAAPAQRGQAARQVTQDLHPRQRPAACAAEHRQPVGSAGPPHRRRVEEGLRARTGRRAPARGRATGLLPHGRRGRDGHRRPGGAALARHRSQVCVRAHGDQGLPARAGRPEARTHGGGRARGAALSAQVRGGSSAGCSPAGTYGRIGLERLSGKRWQLCIL